jgi:hypothetical protein
VFDPWLQTLRQFLAGRFFRAFREPQIYRWTQIGLVWFWCGKRDVGDGLVREVIAEGSGATDDQRLFRPRPSVKICVHPWLPLKGLYRRAVAAAG